MVFDIDNMTETDTLVTMVCVISRVAYGTKILIYSYAGDLTPEAMLEEDMKLMTSTAALRPHFPLALSLFFLQKTAKLFFTLKNL